ncbi:hypothetical protein [Variovorax sp. W6]|uniref:hypothetical protein n=1 Tax=Variovorax sp. W6 TaxID=3093895 RepID=UPI003D808ABC
MFFKKFFIYIVVLLAFSSLPFTSLAGYRDDRLVMWVNLDEGSGGLDVSSTIREFIRSGRIDKECGVDWAAWGSALYMKKRPAGITNDLIKEVFLEKNKASLDKLDRLLRTFRDSENGVDEGLDGVVVYAGKKYPRMMNFVVGGKKIKTYKMTSDKSDPTIREIEEAFCVLLPPVTRAP